MKNYFSVDYYFSINTYAELKITISQGLENQYL
ncbi:MAG: hypothetical protein CM15mP93_14460 [Thiotrichaceae bacterium]|nr:MAG: hypothetical protein CM15mP93_14460 [Thiotrichaceae bacterium]